MQSILQKPTKSPPKLFLFYFFIFCLFLFHPILFFYFFFFLAEDYHPHSPLCFRGCCPSGQTCHNYIESCDGSETDGFTSSFTASTVANGQDVSNGVGLNCDTCWEESERKSFTKNSHYKKRFFFI